MGWEGANGGSTSHRKAPTPVTAHATCFTPHIRSNRRPSYLQLLPSETLNSFILNSTSFFDLRSSATLDKPTPAAHCLVRSSSNVHCTRIPTYPQWTRDPASSHCTPADSRRHHGITGILTGKAQGTFSSTYSVLCQNFVCLCLLYAARWKRSFPNASFRLVVVAFLLHLVGSSCKSRARTQTGSTRRFFVALLSLTTWPYDVWPRDDSPYVGCSIVREQTGRPNTRLSPNPGRSLMLLSKARFGLAL